MAVLRMACNCFLSPLKERATKVAPHFRARAQQSKGGRSLSDAGLERRAEIGGGRELALGEAVDAVVLDDVDHRHVAAHQVHELADADGGGIAVAGDARCPMSVRLASIAPVAMAGMRPWTPLKPCERPRK